MPSFDLIVKTATAPASSWTNKEKAMFHYFNPNGALSKKRETDKMIDAAVDVGKAKTGAILAYGSMNAYNEERLYKMATQYRVDAIELKVTIEMINSDVAAAAKFLETL